MHVGNYLSLVPPYAAAYIHGLWTSRAVPGTAGGNSVVDGSHRHLKKLRELLLRQKVRQISRPPTILLGCSELLLLTTLGATEGPNRSVHLAPLVAPHGAGRACPDLDANATMYVSDKTFSAARKRQFSI